MKIILTLATMFALSCLAQAEQTTWLKEESYYTNYLWDLQKLDEMIKNQDKPALREFVAVGKAAISDLAKPIFPVKQYGFPFIEEFLDRIDGMYDLVEFRFAGSSDSFWALRSTITDTAQ